MNEQVPSRNQPTSSEKPLLTDEEIASLLSRLKKENKKDEKNENDLEAWDKSQGFNLVGDKLERDLIEGMSEYFRIDFERLREIPLKDAYYLVEEFYFKAPKELHPPLPPEVEIELEANSKPYNVKKQIEKWKEEINKRKPLDLE